MAVEASGPTFSVSGWSYRYGPRSAPVSRERRPVMEGLTAVPVPNRKRILASFAIAYVLLACGLSVTAALPELRRSVRMSDTVTSLHGSFFGWGLVVGGLFGSKAIRSLGRLNVLVGSSAALGVGAVLFGTAHSIAQSLSGGALIGLGAAAVVITVPGLVADVFGPERNAIFTQLNIAPGLGGLSFPLLLAIAPSLGLTWRVPTAALPAALLVIMAVFVGPLLRTRRSVRTFPAGRRTSDQTPTTSRDVMMLLRHRPVRHRFTLQVLAVAVEFSSGAWVVVFLREHGFSRASAPLGGAAWAIGLMSSRALTVRLIGWFGRRLEAACFLGGIIGVLMILYGPSSLRLLVVCVAAFSFGPLYTLGVERLFMNAEAAGIHDTAAVSALAAVASGLAITVGPFAVGVVADRAGLRSALLLVPLASMVGVITCLRRRGGEAGMSGQTPPAMLA